MTTPNSHITELLTEHLGFPPIALIDDIINAVNEIMYETTTAAEKYLTTHIPNGSNRDEILQEIEHGTAKLETLLENTLDHNFDKFELYALRNILTIPTGVPIRLKHQECIIPDAESRCAELDLKIRDMLKQIEYELRVKKLLMIQLNKGRKIIRLLRLYKDAVVSIDSSTMKKQVEPLEETIYYLVQLSTELFRKIDEVENTDIESINSNDRERYLGLETNKLLKILGLIGDQSRIDKLLEGVNIEEIRNLYD